MTPHQEGMPASGGGDTAGLDRILHALGAEVNEALSEGALRCGPYILLERIGEGGFGEVFAGVRDDAAARRVAVKILKRGLDTHDVLRRFELEQRALARIDHPGVAAILDAGITDDGRPWFAMPLLEGDPITIACDELSRSLPDRLRLMADVCDAVHAAHVRGIVHRDLKPANVLAAPGPDGRLAPKVIDFGVAKAIEPDDAAGVTRTAVGRRLGTPAYMAPEQLAAADAAADVRSDVYALGVLMAELVAGVRPAPGNASGQVDARLPLRPSRMFASVCSDDPAAAAVITERRGHQAVGELSRALEGDIDAIVAKATMAEPGQRYQSAEAMAEDLRRMAASIPVLARAPSRSYIFRRFVQRHRRGVLVAASLSVGMVAVSAFAMASSIRAERSARLATQQAQRAQEVTELLRGMLVQIDPEVAQGRDRTLLVELLQATIASIRTRGSTIDAIAAAEVSKIVAEALVKLERHRMAMALLDEACARIDAAALTEPDPVRVRALRIERAGLRVARGQASFEAAWAESGVTRERIDEPTACIQWRAALDELASIGALDHPIALTARLRLWRIREVWPARMSVQEFDAAIDSEMEHAEVDPLERWSFRLRRAENDIWTRLLHSYPTVLEECQAELGPAHPLVVRARNRWLSFLVMAGIDSRTSSWGDSITLWRSDEELAAHWGRTAELSDRVVAECARTFGEMHTQTLAARLWQLAARGYSEGPAATLERYRTLRVDVVAEKGSDSKFVQQLDATWRGVTQGYAAGRWW
jgi:serine/threonine protein kinase